MNWFKVRILVAVLFVFTAYLQAQNMVGVYKLWDKGECNLEGRKRSKVFVYMPDFKCDDPRPVVIIMPGGSYTYLGINCEGHDVARYFSSRGFVSVVLRYRMGFYGAHYPQQLEDYRKAMDFLKRNAERFNLDTNKIGAVGFSAGGHLAGCAAILEEGPYRADFAAMIYPVVTMKEPYAHRLSKKHLLRGDESLADKLSLEEHVTGDIAPIFLLHCEDDPTVKVEGSRIFASQLEKYGVNCKVEFYPVGGHGFGVRPPVASGAVGWQDRFIEWLENTVLF